MRLGVYHPVPMGLTISLQRFGYINPVKEVWGYWQGSRCPVTPRSFAPGAPDRYKPGIPYDIVYSPRHWRMTSGPQELQAILKFC